MGSPCTQRGKAGAHCSPNVCLAQTRFCLLAPRSILSSYLSQPLLPKTTHLHLLIVCLVTPEAPQASPLPVPTPSGPRPSGPRRPPHSTASPAQPSALQLTPHAPLGIARPARTPISPSLNPRLSRLGAPNACTAPSSCPRARARAPSPAPTSTQAPGHLGARRLRGCWDCRAPLTIRLRLRRGSCSGGRRARSGS